MAFAFPDIKQSCPVCSMVACAIWKGYYTRGMFCPETDTSEEVAIHVGRCPYQGKDFSFLPETLIPYRQITKRSLSAFFDLWLVIGLVQAAGEQLTNHLVDDKWYVPPATAWSWLKLTLMFCRLNFELLQIPGDTTLSDVPALKIFSAASEVPFFSRRAHWPRWMNTIQKPP